MKPLHKAMAAIGLACAMLVPAGAVVATNASVPAAGTTVVTEAAITEATSSTAAYGHHHGGGHHGCHTQRYNNCRSSSHTWTTDCNGNRYCTTHGGYCAYY